MCFLLLVVLKVPSAWGHQPQITLRSLWTLLKGLPSGSEDVLHKIVGDLPLVLKQIFNLCTVCITWRRGEKNVSKVTELEKRWLGLSFLTWMTSMHENSVAVIFTPTSHDIIQKVRLSHVHRGVNFHLQNKNRRWQWAWFSITSDVDLCVTRIQNLSLCCSQRHVAAPAGHE